MILATQFHVDHFGPALDREARVFALSQLKFGAPDVPVTEHVHALASDRAALVERLAKA